MSEDTEIMFPVMGVRFISESGVPPDMMDPDGNPMGIGDVMSLMLPMLQELCTGMGIGMDVTFGRVHLSNWSEFSEAVVVDDEAFQHPDNQSPIKEGILQAQNHDGKEVTGVITEDGCFIPLGDDGVDEIVEDLMDKMSAEFEAVGDFLDSVPERARWSSGGAEDAEAVRGPQIGSIGEDTGSSDESKHYSKHYECAMCGHVWADDDGMPCRCDELEGEEE
jgi:hypothetical protein